MKVGAWGCSGLGEGRVGGMNKMVLGGICRPGVWVERRGFGM